MASDGRSEKYRLLNEDAIDVNDDLGPIISDKNFSYRRSNRIWKVLILPFVVASLCLNAFFLVTLANPMQVNQRTKFGTCTTRAQTKLPVFTKLLCLV